MADAAPLSIADIVEDPGWEEKPETGSLGRVTAEPAPRRETMPRPKTERERLVCVYTREDCANLARYWSSIQGRCIDCAHRQPISPITLAVCDKWRIEITPSVEAQSKQCPEWRLDTDIPY